MKYIKGKGKNGLINVIKNDDFQYDGSIGLFFFQDRVLNNNNIFQWYASSDFLFSQFKLFDTNSVIPFDKQVYDKNSQGYKLTSGINHSGKLIASIPYVLGIALNGGHKNNTSDIKQIEIASIIKQFNSDSSDIRLIQKNKTAAYSVIDFRKSLAYFNFNVDFGPQFFNQYLLLFHSRWSVQEDRKPHWNPAIGLYFSKSGAPLEIVAGIQLQILDWFNASNSIKTRSERTTINIVAGFTF